MPRPALRLTLFAIAISAALSAHAIEGNRGYAVDSSGQVIKDAFGQCWHSVLYTPELALAGCDKPADGDNDGIADSADKCPNTAAGAKVDAKGCDLDSDGDGVSDMHDKCANTQAGKKVDAKGCVIDTDRDKDGVSDAKDRCPNTKAGAKVNSQGCEVIQGKLVLENVTFASSSAKMTGESSAILDDVAKKLKATSGIKQVTISGYTDDRGAAAYNKALSAKRAKAVMEYLASKGVDAKLMTSRGMGEANPVADNATAEGRLSNRRVELDVSM